MSDADQLELTDDIEAVRDEITDEDRLPSAYDLADRRQTRMVNAPTADQPQAWDPGNTVEAMPSSESLAGDGTMPDEINISSLLRYTDKGGRVKEFVATSGRSLDLSWTSEVQFADFTATSEKTPTQSTIRSYVTYELVRGRSRPIKLHRGHQSEFMRLDEPARLFASPRLVPQQVYRVPGTELGISLRRLVYTTMANNLESAGHTKIHKDTSPIEQFRILKAVLEGLSSLHSANFLHGDLRPENVTLNERGAVALVDYLIAPPLGRLTKEQSAYVSPEARRGEPAQASDIFSFGVLAKRLLGSFLWQDSMTFGPLTAEALSWVFNLCTLGDPQLRPTTHDLLKLLNSSPESLAKSLGALDFQAAKPRVTYLLKNINSPRSKKWTTVRESSKTVTEYIQSKAETYPETKLTLNSDRHLGDMILLLAIDEAEKKAHHSQDGREIKHRKAALAEKFYPSDREVDLPLKDRVHRIHFGTGITLDHDDRKVSSWLHPRLAKRQDQYHQHLAQVEEARLTLLSRASFIFSNDVPELLTSEVGQPDAAEIATLRQWKHLLAIQDHGRWLYPTFQFVPGRAAVATLIQTANESFAQASAWEILSWWLTPRPSLDGTTFAEVLHTPEGEKAIEFALARDAPRD